MLTRSLAAWFRPRFTPIRRKLAPPLRPRVGQFGPERLEARINPAPALISTIAGNDFDTQASLSGLFQIPPDPSGAVGPNHVVSVVNTAIQIHQKDGTLVDQRRLGHNGSTATGSFFATLSPVNGLFDAKVVYDSFANRFIVLALAQTGSTSRILIAVSADSNPTGTWNFLAINSKLNIGGADYWCDYPGISVDEEAIYVTGNMFSFVGGNYAERLWIINKNPLYSGGVGAFNVYDPFALSGGT